MSTRVSGQAVGPAMMVFASLFFALTALFVKMGSDGMPVGIIVGVRFLFMFAVMEALRLSGTIRVRPRNKRLLFWRSVLASAGGVFYFFSVATIPIAEAIVLKYTYPLFAVAIASFFYREKAGGKVLFALALSLAGIFIMVNPMSFNPSPGYLYGLLNGLSAGVAVAFLRQLRATDNSSTVLYFHSLAGAVIAIPFLSRGWGSPGIEAWGYTLLAAIFGMLGQFAIVYGFRYIKTGSGSVVMALEVVFSALLALVVLGQVPLPMKIVGGVMVIAGVASVTGRTRIRGDDIRNPDTE